MEYIFNEITSIKHNIIIIGLLSEFTDDFSLNDDYNPATSLLPAFTL